jgi:hypothetical protein
VCGIALHPEGLKVVAARIQQYEHLIRITHCDAWATHLAKDEARRVMAKLPEPLRDPQAATRCATAPRPSPDVSRRDFNYDSKHNDDRRQLDESVFSSGLHRY